MAFPGTMCNKTLVAVPGAAAKKPEDKRAWINATTTQT
jgi:hypothetical protein